jgi:FkbM family methyltransferase
MNRIQIIQRLIDINEKIIFYPKLKKFYHKTLSNNPVIIDVGANKGQTIDFFKSVRSISTLFSFEANPTLATQLQKKYSDKKNITIIPKGVSNVEGFLKFNINKLDETSSFESLNLNSKYLSKKASVLGVGVNEIIDDVIEVETITLHDFISKIGVSKVDVLKIDTEGHEYKCLQGLFKNSIHNSEDKQSCVVERIQIENHQDDMYENSESFDQIIQLLEANNYTLEKKIKHGFGNFYECIFKYTIYKN